MVYKKILYIIHDMYLYLQIYYMLHSTVFIDLCIRLVLVTPETDVNTEKVPHLLLLLFFLITKYFLFVNLTRPI